MDASVMGFLVAYSNDEWNNFKERMEAVVTPALVDERSEATTRRQAQKAAAVRVWASLRLQTLYRTIKGMMKNRSAYSLLLHATLPDLSDEAHERLLNAKYRCVAACQRYGVMSAAELDDMEEMWAEMPALTVAYIVQESDKDGNPRFFSCLTDGGCKLGADGRREPRYRVELPGQPILGNGKSDNQNHAIIFSRGNIIQAIDANQDGYLEESLKLPNALREFEPTCDAPAPAIVGFREYIFSGLGALGAFAAASEMVFGGLAQRTMADICHSRYHYGRSCL